MWRLPFRIRKSKMRNFIMRIPKKLFLYNELKAISIFLILKPLSAKVVVAHWFLSSFVISNVLRWKQDRFEIGFKDFIKMINGSGRNNSKFHKMLLIQFWFLGVIEWLLDGQEPKRVFGTYWHSSKKKVELIRLQVLTLCWKWRKEILYVEPIGSCW